MTIEQMIEKGCTLDDAIDALQELWEEKVKKQSRTKEIKEAATKVVEAYTNFIKICDPEINDTDLEKAVTQLKTTLDIVGDIFLKTNKIIDLQQKSKEQNIEKSAVNKRESVESLEEFLKKMGW